MSFTCVRGGECTGCMRCRFTDVEGECYNCGTTVYIDDQYSYICSKLYCEDCAEELDEEE